MTLREWIDQIDGLAECRSDLVDCPGQCRRVLSRLRLCVDALESLEVDWEGYQVDEDKVRVALADVEET